MGDHKWAWQTVCIRIQARAEKLYAYNQKASKTSDLGRVAVLQVTDCILAGTQISF